MKYDLSLFIVKGNSLRLNKCEERFLLFIKKLEYPLTEKKIIDYYSNYVTDQREPKMSRPITWLDNGVWQYGFESWTEEEIKRNALNWFDKYLGRFIRKNYLTHLKILPNGLP